jgi:hypothetical protein
MPDQNFLLHQIHCSKKVVNELLYQMGGLVWMHFMWHLNILSLNRKCIVI